MNRPSRYSAVSILTGALALAGCSTDPPDVPGDGGNPAGDGGVAAPVIRIHYRLQGPGSAQSRGLHFWGAGATATAWGMPQLLANLDDFGAYTDVAIKATGDTPDAWLGVIPVHCQGTDCKK